MILSHKGKKMYHFFAYMSRMRQIFRWGLMRNVTQENDQEHALQAAMIAHALALLRNERFHGSVDAEHVAVLAIYHDAGEVLTGDIATPIKHSDPELHGAFSRMESNARNRLVKMLPDDLQKHYSPLLNQKATTEEISLVKAADRLCAYLKCLEELKAGNGEFAKARENIERSLKHMDLPEVDVFLAEFAPSFSLTLDELN